MKIAFVNQSFKQLDNRIRSIRDNLQTNYFNNLQDMIKFSYMRNIQFDRIIITSNNVNSVELIMDLYKYWKDYEQTEIVCIARDVETDLCKYFEETFTTPVVTTMMVKNSSMQTLSIAITERIINLAETYGYKLIDTAQEAETFTFEAETAPEVKADAGRETVPVQTTPIQPVQSATPKKKPGLFGIFKKKRNNEISEEPKVAEQIELTAQEEPVEEVITEEPIMIQEEPPVMTEPVSYIPEETPVQEFEEMNFEEIEENNEITDNFSSHPDPLPAEPEFTEEEHSDIIEPIQDDFVLPQEEIIDIPVVGGEIEEDQLVPPVLEEPMLDETSIEEPVMEAVDIFEEAEEITEEVDIGVLDFSETVVEPQGTTEADFGSVDLNFTEQTPEASVAEIDNNLGNLDVVDAESEYRAATEQPKVIVKEVVKEVVREVNKNHTMLDSITSGINHKILIVTGDRNTGKTVTAITIAKALADKVKTLIVDFDTDCHGLLNYIDYDKFRNFPETVLNGVRLCKNRRIVDNCIMSYDTNLDILTSDFSCEVTEDEIRLTQDLVAELIEEYGVIIVDCPLDKLPLIQDLIATGNTILCIEEEKRGFMNTLCLLESLDLPIRYKKSITMRGNIFLTRCSDKTDTKKLLKYINGIYEADNVNWLAMPITKFYGRVTPEILDTIFNH